MSRQLRPDQIIQTSRQGSLGTISENGAPFVSLVNVAPRSVTSILMLLSDLAKHTKNLDRVQECSLLLVAPKDSRSNPIEGPRLTLNGLATRVSSSGDREARECFLQKHPSATMYAGFADFAFFQIEILEVHFIAGFGRIETIPTSKLENCSTQITRKT